MLLLFLLSSWVDRKCKAARACSRQKSKHPISIAMGTSMTFGPSKINSMILPFFLNYGAPLARAFGPRGAPLLMFNVRDSLYINADSFWLFSGFVIFSQNLIVRNFASKCMGSWPKLARQAESVAFFPTPSNILQNFMWTDSIGLPVFLLSCPKLHYGKGEWVLLKRRVVLV